MKKLIVMMMVVTMTVTMSATSVNAALVPHYHPSWYNSTDDAALGLLEWMAEVGLLEDPDGFYFVEDNTYYNETVYNLYTKEGNNYCGCVHANEEGFEEANAALTELLFQLALREVNE